MAVTTAPTRTRAHRRRWILPASLALLAVVVRLPMYLSPRHVLFDDGVYGVSVLAMRDGARPFHEVFSPQGPLHLPIVFLGDLLGLRTLDAPRTAPVLAGVVITLAVWGAGRRLGANRYGAALAAGLAATTGTLLWTTGPITGDGIAVAFAAAAAWLALGYRDHPTVTRAVLTGLATGAGLLVKVLVLPVALPVAWWLWSGARRVRDLVIAVAASVVLGIVVTAPWGFGNVYDESVKYHQESSLYGPGEQFNKLVTTLIDRDLPLLVALGLGIIAAVMAHRRGWDADTVAVCAWLGAGFLLLVFEPAMFRNHIATIIPPIALLVAMRPPPPRWALVAAIFVVPWWAAHLTDVLWARDYRGDEAALAAQLRALPDNAQVITDEPGFAYRAGLRLPDGLNDASVQRVEQGMITTESVVEAARRPEVCAVAIWSDRYGRDLPGLTDALAEAGYEEAATYGGVRSLWLKPDCDP
jgi:Dolichyl-phosphate-mannose-protein mannosyltransferase